MRLLLPLTFALVGASLSVAAAAPVAGGPEARVAEIRRLLEEARFQLDSLRLETPVSPPAEAAPTLTDEEAAIWREVVAEKRRRKQLEQAFTYTRSSLGFTFNPNFIMGMNGTHWIGDWGAKLDGRFALNENRRVWGANLSLLRTIHEFYLDSDNIYTRLYAFAGGGYYWRREPAGNDWFDTPDRSLRVQVGAGTELGAREMYGTRLTPEIGVQGSRFLTRYQDSDNWGGGRPENDYSFFPYFAVHLNFYFL
jgi:hypothetical protein